MIVRVSAVRDVLERSGFTQPEVNTAMKAMDSLPSESDPTLLPTRILVAGVKILLKKLGATCIPVTGMIDERTQRALITCLGSSWQHYPWTSLYQMLVAKLRSKWRFPQGGYPVGADTATWTVAVGDSVTVGPPAGLPFLDASLVPQPPAGLPSASPPYADIATAKKYAQRAFANITSLPTTPPTAAQWQFANGIAAMAYWTYQKILSGGDLATVNAMLQGIETSYATNTPQTYGPAQPLTTSSAAALVVALVAVVGIAVAVAA